MYPEFTVNRRKSVYMKIICGVRKGMLQKKRIVMLNLTTNSANTIGLNDDEKMFAVGKAWNELHRILTDRYGNFEHYFVDTNEGNGVLHIVTVGLPFLYYKHLMRWWNYLYGSFCWISKVRGSPEGVAGYIFGQYLSGQNATKLYAKMSDNWVCPKFMNYWRMLRACSRDYRKGVHYGQCGYPDHCNTYWFYPIDLDMLITNFKSWLRYLVITGVPLQYVPSRFDFNRRLDAFLSPSPGVIL
ncbi:MAG: hypothetical protein H7836_17315 [Magnetococcus sp. YQC-3]